jgi:hypothetical protein
VLLGLYRLTKVFDRPQRSNGRIEERQQIRHKHVIEEQLAVAVRIFVTQLLQKTLQQPHIFAADDRLRPHRQLLFFVLARRHDQRSCANLMPGASPILKLFSTVLGEASGTQASRALAEPVARR